VTGEPYFDDGATRIAARVMSASDEPDESESGIERLREAFGRAVDEAEEMSDEVRHDVEDAIDDLEERIEKLRKRE
jgi:predicted  nucleic acid-binding Zn-ribbon protein